MLRQAYRLSNLLPGAGTNKAKLIEALLEHGANPLTLCHTGSSVVSFVALSPLKPNHTNKVNEKIAEQPIPANK